MAAPAGALAQRALPPISSAGKLPESQTGLCQADPSRRTREDLHAQHLFPNMLSRGHGM